MLGKLNRFSKLQLEVMFYSIFLVAIGFAGFFAWLIFLGFKNCCMK